MTELLAGITVGVAIAGGAVANLITRKHQKDYTDRVGSFQNLLRSADQDKLRRVKADRGDLQAVVELRKDFPGVPLADARRLVKLL